MVHLERLEPVTKKFIKSLSPWVALQSTSSPLLCAHGAQPSSGKTSRKDASAYRNISPSAGGPEGQIPIRIVRPQNKAGKLRYHVLHGGGWILGNKETHDRLIREIANGANAAVVFVNYTSSPEAKYPIAIEQAYGATKYIAEHGGNLNLDTSHLAVVGDSVGGNMAAVVALLAKERGGPKIDAQVLFYPVTDGSTSRRNPIRNMQRGHG